MGKKNKIIIAIKKQLPHSLSDFMSLARVVPERYPPSIVFDKIGTKRKTIAVRSMDITNKKGIDYVDVDVPQYKAMHGSAYFEKHKERLKKDWRPLFSR